MTSHGAQRQSLMRLIGIAYFPLFVLKNSKNFLYIKRLNYFCIYFIRYIYLDMSLTTIVSNVFKPRQKSLEEYVHDAETLQHDVLMCLLASGKKHRSMV